MTDAWKHVNVEASPPASEVEPSTGEVLVDLLRPQMYKDIDLARLSASKISTTSATVSCLVSLCKSQVTATRVFQEDFIEIATT